MASRNSIFRYSLVLFTLLTLISSGLRAGTFDLEEEKDKKKENVFTADGPYVIYQPGGGTRLISVNSRGALTDTSYAVLPAGFTLHVTDHKGRYPFKVKLHPVQRQAWKLSQPDKVFVMSDPHGKLEHVVSLLQGNRVIDEELRWCFGKNQLVVIGDVFDRGKDMVQICWLLYKLETEAAQAGGQVSFLLGNHETMVLAGDMRYAKDKYKALADTLGVAYSALLGRDTEMGRWLATRNTMQMIGRNLYVHAGLSKEFYELSPDIATVNETMSKALFMNKKERSALSPLTDFLYGSKGPIWYRGAVKSDPKYYPLSQDTLQLIMKHYQAERIIVGHTIFEDISAFYKGKVIGVNVDNEENREKERGRALLIEGNKLFVVGDKGVLRKL